MNEDYYHEQNSCYDYNSFGFDQFQPPQYTVNHPIFNSQNELLNSSNKLMEQMTTLCDLVGQAIQKKEEEKRMAEEQAAKDRYWKIPICYDDDEDNTIAITPVLPIEEPDNSLSMGDEHLDTIPATESDEVIKSSVENLIPIPSEPEGIPDSVCDVPLCNNPTSLEAFKEHSETIIDSNDDSTLEWRPNTLIIPSPEAETFCFDLEEISSGSTTTRSDYSLPDYEIRSSIDLSIKSMFLLPIEVDLLSMRSIADGLSQDKHISTGDFPDCETPHLQDFTSKLHFGDPTIQI
ncbi:hypothetical protein Tco_0892908 [Tanacetum coccineum]|uniref:Uncharacterized protein n=1 Tax=Tanacetum coccineum TaxID=301880 RepID=A0ABQ5C798_9ASTR